MSSKMSNPHHVKYPVFLSDFNEIWILSTDFRKSLKYEVSSKSVQWEQSYSMRADGQTDITELIVAFRNFANAPKKDFYLKIQFVPHSKHTVSITKNQSGRNVQKNNTFL
jgi:hypothetical protein